MINTPTNPVAVASQRRMPTLSPKKTIDNAVTNSGATKPVAEASAIGRKLKPETKNSDDDTSATPRINCRPGRLVPIEKIGDPGTIAGLIISANARNRIQDISIAGNVAERYFAVTSEVPRNTVEPRMSAMPLKGRSARAGPRAAADFFSGKGARSNLVAAAEGGVTAKLG